MVYTKKQEWGSVMKVIRVNNQIEGGKTAFALLKGALENGAKIIILCRKIFSNINHLKKAICQTV